MQPATLEPGTLLVLFSDGVTEAGMARGTEFGDAQLEELIRAHAARPLRDIQQHVLGTVERWAGNDLEDDFTLLLARATATGKEAR